MTVILSTHIVSDVADLCQNFAIINNGQVLVQTSPQEGLAQIKDKIWSITVEKAEVADLEKKHKVINTRFSAGKIVVKIFSSSPIAGMEPSEPTLEDYYFAHIKGFLQ